MRASSSASLAMPVPAPPRMYDGRTISGIADAVADLERLVEGVGEAGLGHGQADLGHGRLEPLAVLGGGDGVGVGADHLDAEALKGTPLVQGHGQVEGGLAAEGRQHGVGPLALDDGFQHLGA